MGNQQDRDRYIENMEVISDFLTNLHELLAAFGYVDPPDDDDDFFFFFGDLLDDTGSRLKTETGSRKETKESNEPTGVRLRY